MRLGTIVHDTGLIPMHCAVICWVRLRGQLPHLSGDFRFGAEFQQPTSKPSSCLEVLQLQQGRGGGNKEGGGGEDIY